MAKRVIKEKPPAARLMGENYRIILVDKVNGYMGRAGLTSDFSLSMKIFGSDNQFITRLREGRNFTLEKALRLEAWLLKAEAMLSGEVPPGELPAAVKVPKAKKAAVVKKPKQAAAQPKAVGKPKKAEPAAKPKRQAKKAAAAVVVNLPVARTKRKRAMAET